MAARISRVGYYYALVKDRPGEACHLLTRLATARVNLLAFSAIPMGVDQTQLVIFPESQEELLRGAENHGIVLQGPHHAFLVRGDDELGALVDLHLRLSDAAVNVSSSTGMTDGRGGYGYMLYVRPEEYERAAQVLGV